MRGRDASKALRECGFKGMIIGVTANVLRVDMEDFIAQGANCVVQKPMNAEKFEGAVRSVLQMRIGEMGSQDFCRDG